MVEHYLYLIQGVLYMNLAVHVMYVHKLRTE
jgi:hypothetical protein